MESAQTTSLQAARRIEAIFIATRGSAAMRRVEQVDAIANRGLAGDRYLERTGYWTGVDECEVTLIRGEDLDEIHRATGLHVHDGEHRRNLITRGVQLDGLVGRRFRIGEAVLCYDRPRPPCGHVQQLTERGMTRALYGRGGICARVVKSGRIRVGDALVVLDSSGSG